MCLDLPEQDILICLLMEDIIDGEMSDYIPTDAELQAGFDGIPKI